MSSCVVELDSILQSMLALKAPGVTGGKVTSITALCNANIQSETVLIQRIYTHFKKAPATHKLGVLYVVDSVTRAWVEQARKTGQALSPGAPDGTFVAGINRVTELLPSFLNDIINTASEDHKARILKLIDIWERGNTFPSAMLASFRPKVSAPALSVPQSTTPNGTPPKDFIPLNGNGNGAGAAVPPPDTSKILQALADMAKTNATATGTPSQANPGNVTNMQNHYPQNMSSVNSAPFVPPVAQGVSTPAPANGGNMYGGMSSLPTFVQQMPAGQRNMQANPALPQGGSPENIQQQLQFLQQIQAMGIPQDQWAATLSTLMAASQTTGTMGGSTNAVQQNWSQNGYGGNQSRDRNDQHDVRSPSGRYRSNRSRSRSPSAWDRRREPSPPRRRDSPTYGEYGRDGGRGGAGRQGRGRGGDEYRQRSPAGYRRSASPGHHSRTLPPPGPKHLVYDQSLPPDHIKVLSRTLFVGGVTSSEDTLRGIFSTFGLVQTCIVNTDKRHAFVKMLTRTDAMKAKEGMERYKSADMQLRTRWGVGFGPRDCSDYQTGISVIPIDRLTDADRKWMLTAEYGGTGGKSIESGLVVEEPDIEIGAGVSSKAISRRMATDKGGQQGPRSSRDGPPHSAPRYRQPEPNERNPNNIGVSPAVPNFGFNFPGMPNGFPGFPPGFTFPGQAPTQPPPPGAS